ncbi:MAG: DNA mismatch repair endonuclease MutL [Porphyromonas sp.]|nr:DNA mismatch repair endonuclease MutL [Porphyromonas sp.]
MDNLVRLLPDNIANQIAAGEVIQRPASVVKELVENAVDAGATEIYIHIKDAGKTLIQVIDNGKGMDAMDARMAFERHATSKIRQAEDLFALSTLGFRGEALPSIAAVSHITLQTRTEDAPQGVRIELEGSKVLSSEPVGCAVGANFAVRHLFYNVPARRKFLKQDETEYRHIVTEVQNIAAVRPEVAFTLKHNEMVSIQVPASSLKQRVIDLFGKRFVDKLLTLDVDTPMIRIRGFVSMVSSTRKRGANQYFFANERYMRHPYFHRMVLNAYGNMIPSGEQPEYFLYLTVDPANIDVNISPTKTEIKFANEQDIGSILYSSVREVLMVGASVPTLDFVAPGKQEVQIPTSQELPHEELQEPPTSPEYMQVVSRLHDNPNEGAAVDLSLSNDSFEMPDLADWDSFYKEFESRRSQSSGRGVAPSAKSLLPQPRLLDLPIPEEQIGEPWIYADYAIFPTDAGLSIMHVGRARQCVIYHDLKRSLERGTILSRRMLFPSLIDFSPQENLLLKEHLGTLLRLGFDLSDMGQGSYVINALPDGVAAGAEEELVKDLLAECDQSGREPVETLHDRLVLILTESRLRHIDASISSADALELYRQLTVLPEYLVSPLGQPTLSLISKQELEKRFK